MGIYVRNIVVLRNWGRVCNDPRLGARLGNRWKTVGNTGVSLHRHWWATG